MREITECWVWLANLVNIGFRRTQRLLEVFGGPYEVWHAQEWELRALDFMTPQSIEIILNAHIRESAGYAVDSILRKGIDIICVDHDTYPSNLRHIKDPPFVLFRRGDKHSGQENYIAVVGTRHPTVYGCSVTRTVVRGLSTAGYTVVSGMAMGIDTAAHEAALNSGGQTVAVLACGPEKAYPASNRKLMERIIEQGTVYSEHLPGTPPLQQHFPWRNRIISGISAAVIVIEAAERSGALITASYAGEQGRDIFAVPGNITSPLSQGSNALIRDGAFVVTSVSDILESVNPFLLGNFYRETGSPADRKPGSRVQKDGLLTKLGLSENELRIVKLLQERGPVSTDEIIKRCEKPAGETTSTLVFMELKGLLRSLPGSVYEFSGIFQ